MTYVVIGPQNKSIQKLPRLGNLSTLGLSLFCISQVARQMHFKNVAGCGQSLVCLKAYAPILGAM